MDFTADRGRAAQFGRVEANVEFIDDPSVDGMDTQALRAGIPSSYAHTFLIVADRDVRY